MYSKYGKNGWKILLMNLIIIVAVVVIAVIAGRTVYKTWLSPYLEKSKQIMEEKTEKKEMFANSYIPETAHEYDGHYYYIYDDIDNWEDAMWACKKLGGHLAVITSEEENEEVYAYLESKGYSSAYIGAYMETVSDSEVWRWETGENMSYTYWADGEPDSDNGECYCGAYTTQDDSKWRALERDYTEYYICEWDSFEAGDKDNVKDEIARPDSCLIYKNHLYAIIDTASSWEEAEAVCESYGGHLAVINDVQENEVLFDYMTNKGYSSAFFGYSIQDDGSWEWVDGSTSSYTNWGYGEPNGEGYEKYGQFYSGTEDYMWNDGNLEGGDVFLFEKELGLTDSASESDSGENGRGEKITMEFVEPELATDLSSRYELLGGITATATSEINQEGYDNSAAMVLDGNLETSWQEGVAGDGSGEKLTLKLGRACNVKYLVLYLGNWRSDDYFAGNNRPKEMTITVGKVSQQITFPSDRTAYCIRLSSPCRAKKITLQIDSVYQGEKWDDTCIAEVEVYGEEIAGNE